MTLYLPLTSNIKDKIHFCHIQVIPEIHRTVQKKIRDDPCPSLRRHNDAYVCLETIYPKAFVWEFKYIGESSAKELEFQQQVPVDLWYPDITQDNGYFMGKII